MCSKKLQRKCINCSVWNFFPSSVEIISFLNTAWKEFQNLQFIHFLHAVSYLMWINSFTTNDRKTWQWWKMFTHEGKAFLHHCTSWNNNRKSPALTSILFQTIKQMFLQKNVYLLKRFTSLLLTMFALAFCATLMSQG